MLLTQVCHVMAGDHSSLLEGAHLPHLLDLLHIKIAIYAPVIFMYRRPTLCTLHIAVDFLKYLKIAVVLGGGATGI